MDIVTQAPGTETKNVKLSSPLPSCPRCLSLRQLFIFILPLLPAQLESTEDAGEVEVWVDPQATSEVTALWWRSISSGAHRHWVPVLALPLYQPVQDAITEHHSLNHKKFILSQFWRLEVQVQGVASLVSDEKFSSWLADGGLLSESSQSLSSVRAWWREMSGVSSAPYNDTSCNRLGPHPHDFILTLITSLNILFSSIVTLELGLQYMNLVGGGGIQFSLWQPLTFPVILANSAHLPEQFYCYTLSHKCDMRIKRDYRHETENGKIIRSF